MTTDARNHPQWPVIKTGTDSTTVAIIGPVSRSKNAGARYLKLPVQIGIRNHHIIHDLKVKLMRPASTREITNRHTSTREVTNRRDMIPEVMNRRDLTPVVTNRHNMTVEIKIHRDLRVTIVGAEVRCHTRRITGDLPLHGRLRLCREIILRLIKRQGRFIA